MAQILDRHFQAGASVRTSGGVGGERDGGRMGPDHSGDRQSTLTQPTEETVGRDFMAEGDGGEVASEGGGHGELQTYRVGMDTVYRNPIAHGKSELTGVRLATPELAFHGPFARSRQLLVLRLPPEDPMRRLALVAVLTALFTPSAVWTAESVLAPSADSLAAGAAPAGSLRVVLAKNGNVRYAPTMQSKVIVTLPAKSEVEVLGPAKVAGWYVIRFPREGSAWVHSKVLQAVDGGKRWRVTEDRSRARDDSTLRSEIVGELNKGEILEDKGRINGDWRAVYLPNAVAYISSSVLDMPHDLGEAQKQAATRAAEAVQAWGTAQSVYASFFDQLKSNPQNALVLDWQGLAVQLDSVIRYHPDADVRVSAQRIKDGIVNVAAAAKNVQLAKGLTPTVGLAVETTPIPGATATPVTTATAKPGVTQTSGMSGDPLAPALLDVPNATPAPAIAVTPIPLNTAIEPLAPTEILKAPVVPAVAAKAYAAEGFVTQQNFDQVGVTEVLVDGDSNIVAFLKVQVGKDVQLSEYYWRWVGVRGEVQKVEQTKHNLGRDVPLVIVDSLSLAAGR